MKEKDEKKSKYNAYKIRTKKKNLKKRRFIWCPQKYSEKKRKKEKSQLCIREIRNKKVYVIII